MLNFIKIVAFLWLLVVILVFMAILSKAGENFTSREYLLNFDMVF